MARKSETLDEQRNGIRKRYRHGPRARRDLVAYESLSDFEKGAKREAACFLKAAGYSHTYIGEALGFTRGQIKGWFEDTDMRERMLVIQDDLVQGAVKLLKTYSVELIEMLVNIARESDDDGIRLKAITEGLDRMGLAKVNKSESAVTKTERSEVDITDKTGLVDALQEAPPEVQQEVARKLEEAMAMSAEHLNRDVTHA